MSQDSSQRGRLAKPLGWYLMACVMVLVVVLLSAARPVAVTSGGRVTFVSGVVNVRKSQIVAAGSRIKTGNNGRVEVTFPNGHRLRIGPSSDIQLVSYNAPKKQTLLYLHQGRSWNNVKPGQGSRVVVRTKHSTASVLGTIYDVALGGLATTTSVVHGSVGVHLAENTPQANLFDQLPALPSPTPPASNSFEAPTEIANPVHEIPSPVQVVPGPYEVSRDQWLQIVENQQISMGADGKAQISTMNQTQLEKTDEWFRWNRQMDKQSPEAQE